MFRMSFANLVSRKLRLLTTALAIILGVAFTAGTMILADTMSASFCTAIEQLSDGVLMPLLREGVALMRVSVCSSQPRLRGRTIGGRHPAGRGPTGNGPRARV